VTLSLLSFHGELVTEWKSLFRSRPKESIILITGPPGAGKTKLLRQALNGRRNTFVIDCKRATSVQELLDILGTSIGFSPSFNTLNTITVWLEYFLPGLSKRTSLSPSVKTQLESMLSTLGQALIVNNITHITEHADFPVVVFDGLPDFLQNIEIQPNGSYVLSNAASTQIASARDEREKAELVLNLLMDWMQKHTTDAHFIITGDNPYGEEAIENCDALKRSKSIKFRVKDISLEQTNAFIHNKLPQVQLEKDQMESAYDKFGGRMADISSFLSKLRSDLPVQGLIKSKYSFIFFRCNFRND
jgi:hypothetical protein